MSSAYSERSSACHRHTVRGHQQIRTDHRNGPSHAAGSAAGASWGYPETIPQQREPSSEHTSQQREARRENQQATAREKFTAGPFSPSIARSKQIGEWSMEKSGPDSCLSVLLLVVLCTISRVAIVGGVVALRRFDDTARDVDAMVDAKHITYKIRCHILR